MTGGGRLYRRWNTIRLTGVLSALLGAVTILFSCVSTPHHIASESGGVTTDGEGALFVEVSMGHSHNDYERDRPLVTALESGMLGIEVDVFLRNGELLVAHVERDLDPRRTLRALYLDPLYTAFVELGGEDERHSFGGRVRPSGRPVMLHVDFKEENPEAWRELESQLSEYPGMVRRVREARSDNPMVEQGPVIVVTTGNAPRELIAAADDRLTAISGRIPDDLDSDLPPHLMPTLSTSFASLADLPGVDEQGGLGRTIGEIANRAEEHGRLVRLWGANDSLVFWRLQAEEQAQLINTDRPDRLGHFLQEYAGASTTGATYK